MSLERSSPPAVRVRLLTRSTTTGSTASSQSGYGLLRRRAGAVPAVRLRDSVHQGWRKTAMRIAARPRGSLSGLVACSHRYVLVDTSRERRSQHAHWLVAVLKRRCPTATGLDRKALGAIHSLAEKSRTDRGLAALPHDVDRGHRCALVSIRFHLDMNRLHIRPACLNQTSGH